MKVCICTYRKATEEENDTWCQLAFVRIDDPKCSEHAPIEPAELWEVAQKAWKDSQTNEEREDLQQSKTGELDWSQGFVWGLSEAVKRLGEFGMSDGEIRNALGLVKK